MKPLCIDCDGTLLRTDLLHETLVRVLLRKPWTIFSCLFWLKQGRAYLKLRLAKIADINTDTLPYREEIVDYIKTCKAQGSRILLVTAASRPLAAAIAEECGLFDEVLASDSQVNLKGSVKRDALVERFGHTGFNYAGDSSSDFPVWEAADEAIIVGRGSSFLARVSAVNPRVTKVGAEKPEPGSWLKLIRIHQWVKNLIIFVPLVTAHKVFDAQLLLPSVAAFLSFSLLASATYIVNDLYDLDHDRAHKTKRHRPLASGAVSLPAGLATASTLGTVAVLLAWFVSPLFLAVLGIYLVGTLLYSSVLKRVVLVDVVVLASLYTWRLVAGAAVTGIVLSTWLLAFAMFVFTSLAMAKRFVELNETASGDTAERPVKGRGYRPGDKDLIGILGLACAVVSVLVTILYVNSPEVRILYTRPQLLLLLAPLFLYWLARVWLLASRGQLHEDPVLFAVRDGVSYLVGAGMAAVIVAATI
jgi:4-hydroxybenzoate polyprenyltransferase/phosphoserine phosphatase